MLHFAMNLGASFAVGVPSAGPSSFGPEDPSAWPVLVLCAGIALLLFEYGYIKWRTHRREQKPEHSIEPRATTMPCSYCGRENDLSAANCKDCGTPFPANAENIIEADSA